MPASLSMPGLKDQ